MHQRFISASIAAAAFIAITNTAHANQIGVQFQGGNGNTSVLASTTSAGVMPQANFNVFSGNNAAATILNDNTGTATTATLAYNAANSYNTGAPDPGNGDEILNSGLLNGTDGISPTLTLAHIPYSSYSLIVYTLDDTDRTERVTVTQGAASTSLIVHSPQGNSTGYVDQNATTPYTYLPGGVTATAGSDYVLFTGLTGDATITADARIASFPTNGNDNSFVNGFQIIDTSAPEPASLGLAALGAIGLLTRRRRA